MKSVFLGVSTLVFLSGCVAKSTLRKDLQPVANGLQFITEVDCAVIPDSRCPAAQAAARTSLQILNQLGVTPSAPLVPPAPEK